MDDDEEHRHYGDSTILEPIIEQQDDETTTSPMSTSSMDMSFIEEERRAREEIQQFEELEKQLASTNRRGVRVKFDDEQTPSITQTTTTTTTTVIKTEPYFHVNSTEDPLTKHFYQNEFSLKIEKENQPIRQTAAKTPSEPDSLEGEYFIAFQEKNVLDKQNDELNSSSPGKSILKKCPNKEKTSKRPPSPLSSSSSLKKKHSSSSHSDSNEVLHLAEVTAKETSSQPRPPIRSLFEPTINIFDSTNSYQSRRPSRLRYYIKPYRGETYIPPETTKQRSRSLSEQRLAAQQSTPPVWYPFSNQYNRPFYRKQHVSWSPVRDYIHQGREKTGKSLGKKSPNKTGSLLSSTAISSSNPCLRTSSSSSSMIPISIRYNSSQIRPSPAESFESSSLLTTRSLTPISQYEEKKEILFVSPLPDILHPNKKEHNQTIQRYDQLLEKMRVTDQQLQTLSKSWLNNIQQKTNITTTTTVTNKTTTTNRKEFLSPMVLQMCLLILVIFNLLVVYFFNDINILWSQYVSQTVIAEHHDEGTSSF